MTGNLVLASTSQIRSALLTNAGVPHEVEPARLDEDSIKAALQADGVSPRDQADALAEAKARKISDRNPGRMVLGSDQILDHGGRVLSKPADENHAREQLKALCGERHDLYSAVVIYRDGKPLWRHIGRATLTMRVFSPEYLESYLARNWESVRWSVGGYKLEEEGVRLFSRIDGDYFTILGLPLLEVLGYLTLQGEIDG